MRLLFPRLVVIFSVLLKEVSVGFGAQIHLGDPPIEGQFTLYGASPGGGLAGLPVATGDFDGDGFLDLVATPMRARVSLNGVDRQDAGLAYVVFGDGTISGFVDMANRPPHSAVIHGARAGDHTGDEVWAGDVNGDQLDDILLCAQDSDGPGGSGRNRAGSLYIIFGSASLRGASIDLLAPPPGVTQIHGAEVEDRLGIWVRSGDLNGDQIDDILVGADGADGPSNTRINSGSAHILFGSTTWDSVIDMATPPTGSVLFHGVDPSDRMGATTSVADINGDGRMDALISAGFNRAGAALGGGPAAGGGDGPGNSRQNCGETYVFFQPPEGAWPSVVDAAAPPVSVSMTVAFGEVSSDYCGEEIIGADLDSDGADEWIIGAFPARSLAGNAYVLSGGKNLENRVIDLLSPPMDVRFTRIRGNQSGAITADTILAGDIDQDGFLDLLVGSPNYTISPVDTPDIGRVDVFFGSPELFPPVMTLNSIPSTVRTMYFIGPERGDILAYSMAIGDWDMDGHADPMPNGMNGDGFQNQFATTGDAYVVSGALLASLAPSFTQSPTVTESPTITATPTTTETSTITPTPTESATLTDTGTPTSTDTPSPTFSVTLTPSNTETPTITPTPRDSATPTATISADFNEDGVIDAKDLLILLDRFTTEKND